MASVFIGLIFLTLVAVVICFCAITVFSPGKKKTVSIFSAGNVRLTGDETFWQRQFRRSATEAQKRFDLLFGAFLPILCFFYDPLIFKSEQGVGFLSDFRPLSYSLAVIAISSLMVWEVWGTQLGRLGPVFSGIFAVSAAVSMVIGICMLPFSLIGLIVIIGVLGFTPFFVVFIYGRAAWRAFPKDLNQRQLQMALGAAFIVFSGILTSTWVLNERIRASIEAIKTGDSTTIHAEVSWLRLVRPLVETGSLKTLACYKENLDRREALLYAYRTLGGKDPACIQFSGY